MWLITTEHNTLTMEFTTDILELFGAAYMGDFSKYMYQADAYTSVFYVALLLPMAVAFIYYILLDHILLARRGKWMLIGAITAVVNTVVSTLIAHTKVSGYVFMQNIYNADISASDYLSFAFIVLLWTCVFYTVFSLVFKNFSSRCRNIPF